VDLLPDNLLLRPWLPLPVVVALVLLLAALAAWSYFKHRGDRPARRAVLLVMRWVSLMALGVVLLGLSTLPGAGAGAGRVLDRPTFTVLIDTSGSMRTEDTAAGSRLDLIRNQWLTPDNLRAWRQHAEVSLLAFDDTPRPRPIGLEQLDQPQNRSSDTRLIAAVQQAVTRGDADRSAGVLVLSDGRDTTGQSLPPTIRLAQQRGLAIHSVTLGGASLRRDLSVAAAVEPARLIVNEAGTLRIMIMQRGAAGETTTLTVTRPDGRTQQQQVTLTTDPATTVTVPVRHDTPGLAAYRVALGPLPGERDTANNTQTAYAQVGPERLRTLLIEGQPSWDSKLLANALRQDPRIDITQLTQLADGRLEAITTRRDGEAELPEGRAALAAYDVVLLGRRVERAATPEFFNQLLQAVREDGVNLVLTRGLPIEPETDAGRSALQTLAPVLPLRWRADAAWWGATDAQLTPSGQGHPAFTSAQSRDDALPRPTAIQRGLTPTPAAVVLATARTGETALPYVLEQRGGSGRVAAVLARGLWRQRMDQGGRSAEVFDRFWTQLVRAVALGRAYDPGEPATLRLSRTAAELGEPVTAELLLRPGYAQQRAQAYLVNSRGQRQALTLTPEGARQRSVAITPESPGAYRVVVELPGMEEPNGEQIKRLASPLVVQRTDREQLNTTADPVPLRLLAEATGGRVFPPDGADRVTELLTAHRATLNAPPQPRYVWARMDVLCGLLVWLGLEWILRRRMGLW